jgi:APA family basic amino acid/polyamine antiporter
MPRPYRTPLVPLVPVLGILVCLAMMASLDVETWYRLVIGLCIYFSYSRHHSHLAISKR